MEADLAFDDKAQDDPKTMKPAFNACRTSHAVWEYAAYAAPPKSAKKIDCSTNYLSKTSIGFSGNLIITSGYLICFSFDDSKV